MQRHIIALALCSGSVAMAGSVGTQWTVDDDLLDLPDADFTTIQEAIDAAVDDDFVFVYPGHYPELIDFQGKAIRVHAIKLGQATIDGTGLGGSVVTFAEGETDTSVLDGFRIGNGTGTIIVDPIFGAVPCGGGIICIDSSPTILNCDISSNACWGGAGIMNLRSSPGIRFSTIHGNASEGHGGGIYNLDHSSPVIGYCTIEGNDSSWGGGMTNTVDCDPLITNTTFSNNTVLNVGGGMFNRSRSSPTIANCSFIDNIQTGNPLGSGGGVCNYGVGNGGGPCYPIITNCHFEGNVVNGDGGAINNAYDTHPLVTSCTFINNTAGRNGGGLACSGNLDPYFPSNAVVVNCQFSGNTAASYGGGFHSRASEPSVEGSLFSENTAGIGGGGASFEDSPGGTVEDTVFCANVPGNLWGTYIDLGGNTDDAKCGDCPSDVDGDGEVGVDDILALIAAWGPCSGCAEDIDGDGDVDVNDILAVIAAWGPCV